MTDNLEQLIKEAVEKALEGDMDAINNICLLYTSPSPRDRG